MIYWFQDVQNELSVVTKALLLFTVEWSFCLCFEGQIFLCFLLKALLAYA